MFAQASMVSFSPYSPHTVAKSSSNLMRAQNILPLKDKSKPLDEIFKKYLDLVEDEFNGPHHGADTIHHHFVYCLDEEMSDVFRRMHKPFFDCVQDTHEPVSDVLPKQHESRFVACPQGGVGGAPGTLKWAPSGRQQHPFVKLTGITVVGNAPDPCRRGIAPVCFFDGLLEEVSCLPSQTPVATLR